MGGAIAGYEVYKFSPLKFSGPVLATGVGLLGSMKSYQFTPYPVTTAATASTVPVTTSPVPQARGSRQVPPVDSYPTSTISLLVSSYQDPTVDSRPTSVPALSETPTTSRDDNTTDNLNKKEDESVDHETKQVGEVNVAVVHMDSDAPTMTTQTDKVNNDVVGADTDITATTIAELECPYANCQYVTGVGKDCVEYGMEMYAAKYMQNELKIHLASKHTEYGDAAGTTDSKGRYKSSGRSNKSKKRNKSRRSDDDYSGMIC